LNPVDAGAGVPILENNCELWPVAVHPARTAVHSAIRNFDIARQQVAAHNVNRAARVQFSPAGCATVPGEFSAIASVSRGLAGAVA